MADTMMVEDQAVGTPMAVAEVLDYVRSCKDASVTTFGGQLHREFGADEITAQDLEAGRYSTLMVSRGLEYGCAPIAFIDIREPNSVRLKIVGRQDDQPVASDARPAPSQPEEIDTNPHRPFRDEKVSLLVAAKQAVDDYRAAIDLAVGKVEPELFKTLGNIFAWTVTMSEADRKQFLAEEHIEENGNQKNPLTPVVKGFFQRVRAVDPSNYTKYAGALALAELRGIKAGDFATWVRGQGGIEEAYNTYKDRGSEKEINPEESQTAHTRRAEQIEKEISAFLGEPRSRPIEAPDLSADLQEGLNYIAVIRKIEGSVVILRTLDYERPAITRMLHRFAIAAPKVPP